MAMMLTADERRICWYVVKRDVQRLVQAPAYTVTGWRQNDACGGDAWMGYDFTKTGIECRWRHVEITFSPGACIPACLHHSLPAFDTIVPLCSPVRGHGTIASIDWDNPLLTARLSFKRAKAWAESLTDAERIAVLEAASWERLHFVLADLWGPPPRIPERRVDEPPSVGDQFALFEAV